MKKKVYPWFDVAPRLAEIGGFGDAQFEQHVDALAGKAPTEYDKSFSELTKKIETSLATMLIGDIMTGSLPARDKEGLPLELDEIRWDVRGLSWLRARHAHLTKKEINTWLKKNRRLEKFMPVKRAVIKAPAGLDYPALATRDELIDAFGMATGMNQKWFENVSNSPDLKAARKQTRTGRGASAIPSLFCPFEVMQWLVLKGRRGGVKLSSHRGWTILESKFPVAYLRRSIGDPRGR